MSQWFHLFEMASSFIEAWIAYLFIGIFLPDRAKGKGRFFLLSLGVVGTMQLAEYLQVPTFLITLWFVFFICMTTVVMFQVDVFYAVSLVSFYILCVYILDFFCMTVMGLLGRNQQFAHMILNQLSLWRCQYLVVDKLLLCCFYILVRHLMRRELHYTSRMIFLVSFLGFLGVGFLSWMTIQEITLHTLFSWSLCIIFLVVVYFLLLIYTNYRKEKEMRILLQLKEQMVKQEYELVFHHQKELSHDLKNHILILSSMLGNGQYREAEEYMKQLSEPMMELSAVVWTGNPTVDVLLNHAKKRSEKECIRFTIQVDAVSWEKMEEQDICCLFANLLDNAYEAAQKCREEDRWIHVKLRRINDMVFLHIQNSMTGTPKRGNLNLLSSKKDGGLHGIGINSARKAVEKYGGSLEYEYKDGIFSVMVTFLGSI